ncbi:hypothetical protein [Mesorhizobium sp.]|uniref:hypothetical protein n=1 Tax=Mesorhizobium sp. TaxID=1871066 RepID=UPI0025B9B549|nr:hypothetical protein [Mesorhizobium sp.]
MQILLAGAQAPTSSPTQEGEDPADPYLTVLTYFNALRELWGRSSHLLRTPLLPAGG